MTKRRRSPPRPNLRFAPVPVTARHDGWTPERQARFIEALAECGCVTDAAKSVGMAVEGAYRLRRRIDALAFRQAWDAAIDYAVRRLSDAALARALHGVPVPHFWRGEQVGEHRRYDEALTRFILRYRDPFRYARALDRLAPDGDDEAFAIRLARLLHYVEAGVVDPPVPGSEHHEGQGDVA